MTTFDRRFLAFFSTILSLAAACSSDSLPDEPGPVDAGSDATVDVAPDRSLDETSSPDGTGGSSEGSNDVSVTEASPDGARDAVEELPCAPCASGICLDGSTCAECGRDQHCAAPKPRCDVPNNTCVACLPGTSDNCPAGQYCTATFTCVPGCKGNAACASGVCDANHNCDRCISDLECGGGNVCGSGVCGPTCTMPADCTGGFTCCNSHCVDTTRDIGNCAACSSSCQIAQFCGTGGCNTPSFANICLHAKTTAVLNGLAPDDAANMVVQNAILANCAPPPMASTLAANASGPINGSTGQPLIGGNHLLTATGGNVVQKHVKYLESSRAAPIRLEATASGWEYRGQSSGTDAGSVVASLPFDAWTPSHDILVIELVRDPLTGTLSLVLFGQQAETTAAAAWFFANTILPNRATYTASWYVFEWTGTPDAGPSGTDTFQLKASGP